jgi:putative peptidoglycan lipid II flippase
MTRHPADLTGQIPPEPDDPEAQSVAEAQAIPRPPGTVDDDETVLMPSSEGEPPPPSAPAGGARSGAVASAMVAAGIFLSRIAGLVRTSLLARYFGTSIYADVFNAALRMPNFIQNLLGEGTLSASFIPVYSELLHEGKKEEAGKVAGAIFSLLLAAAGALAFAGVVLAPVLTSLFLPGFEGQRRELTIEITRILFPMTGVLVLSAWSLGILNSHRYFFLSYFAPVLWNVAMIAALLLLGHRLTADRLVVALSWAALLGGGLQLAVQLPAVIRLERSLKIRWDTKLHGVREAARNAGPAVMGRGVVQISSWLDTILASLLAAGAVATFQYATTLYVLPVSLFGMSVAAAELPELARQRARGNDVLRDRAAGGLERIAFYVVPSFIAFVALGDVVVGGLFERGQFGRADTLLVYVTLLGFAVGLMATTSSRLLSSTFFALRDTKTPARYATVRVVLSVVLGIVFMLQFEPITLGRMTIPAGVFGDLRLEGKTLGVFGLTLAAGMAAWVENWLLKRALRNRIGKVAPRHSAVIRMYAAAILAAAAAWGVRLLLPDVGPLLEAVAVLGVYGIVYFGAATLMGLEQSGALFRRLKNLTGRG